MHQLNPEMDLQSLAEAVAVIRKLCLPEGMPAEELGTMTDERWAVLTSQLVELGLLPEGTRSSAAFTTQFVR